jgi:very-short-patch-repair endonuclease
MTLATLFSLAPADYLAMAEERGFTWLGPEVPNTATKAWWKCENNHSWAATYGNIRQGYGCPFCAGKAPKTPEDYREIARQRGYRWLGPEVPNVNTKTTWECEQGHRWEATYSHIQRGSGCPVCLDIVNGARVSQVQRELCQMLEGELNCRFGTYNIDVALDSDGIPIAVEYDSWYWHAGREDNDAQRDRALIEAGWSVLHVRSNTMLPTQEQLDAAIASLLRGEREAEILLDDWGEGPTKLELGQAS